MLILTAFLVRPVTGRPLNVELKLGVLSSFRKLVMSGSARMSSGSLFHADGPV